MRSRSRSQSGPKGPREGSNLELVRVRRPQRDTGDAGRELRGRSRRRGGRGRPRPRHTEPVHENRGGLLGWLQRLFGGIAPRPVPATRSEQEARTLQEFQRHFQLTFSNPDVLKLALTHRSYLSVTGQGPRESNERLEFLGDSVLGLVTSEFLYRRHPDEHEGDLTKNKSLLVSKAILSRRALAMGLGRFVLMSHSEVESGGRQRLSILADAFEAVIGAVYLDQGFEAAREFIHRWLLREASEIVADKRHTNYKSHLQEYVQSTWRTHPVYRIRSEIGPDHSKHFLVEVMVGKRNLGEGRGRNKKEAEQAAARDALDRVGAVRAEARAQEAEGDVADSRGRGGGRAPSPAADATYSSLLPEPDLPGYALDDAESDSSAEAEERRRRRGRRGGRGRRGRGDELAAPAAPMPRSELARDPDREPVSEPAREPVRRAESTEPSKLAAPIHRLGTLPVLEDDEPVYEVEPIPPASDEDEHEEIGRPEGPLEERHVDPYAIRPETESELEEVRWESEPEPAPAVETIDEEIDEEIDEAADESGANSWRADDEPEPEEPTKPGRGVSPAFEAPSAAPRPSEPPPAPPSFGRRRGRR